MPAGAGPFTQQTHGLPPRRFEQSRGMFAAVQRVTNPAPVTAPSATPLSALYIPQILNIQQLQTQLNAIFAIIYGSQTGFGPTLPAATASLNGRIFVLTPSMARYQLQDGVWKAI